MRITMLTTSFPKFPQDSHAPWILPMAKALVRSGHRVTVVTPSATDLGRRANFGGVDVLRFRYMVRRMECVAYGANIPANVAASLRAKIAFPFFVIGFLFASVRHLRHCELVHAQFGYSGVFAALALSLTRSRHPLIVSFYGRDVAHAVKHRRLYRLCFRRASRVLVLSRDMREALIAAGFDDSKIRIQHLGVDGHQFDGGERRQEHTNCISFLIVANFVQKKGIPFAIDAFAMLARERSDLHLTLVGRGPLESMLRQQVAAHHLEDAVTFLNNYESSDPRGAVLRAMKQADIFVLTGVTTPGDYGGTPVVLMEAGAMGLPAITTANAGNAEVVLDQQTGLVVPEGDVDALYLAMKALAESEQDRCRFGAAAATHIRRSFDVREQERRLEAIYQQAAIESAQSRGTRA